MMDQIITISDFDKICRVCLLSQDNMLEFSRKEIIQMIKACASNQGAINEKLPKNICNLCYNQLKNSYEFLQKYMLAIQILTDIILKSEQDEFSDNISIKNESYDNFDCNNEESRSSFDCKLVKKESEESNQDKLASDSEDIPRKKQNLHKDASNFKKKDESITNHDGIYDSNAVKGDQINLFASYSEDNDSTFESESDNKIKSKRAKKQFKRRRRASTVDENDCVCDICGKKVKKKKYLSIHKLSHSDQKPHKCEICGKTFKHSFTLTNHMKVIHTHANQRGMCFICGKFMKPKSLRYHLITHEPIMEKYKCNICQRIYLREELLNRHFQEKHSKNTQNQKFYCDICNKGYSSKICLGKHKAYMHTERKKYDCNICGKIFSHPTNVNVHINAAHKDLRPFICTVCNKAFHTKALLGKHMFGHTGERPHTCNVCGKSFGFKNVLNTHMKVHNK